MQSPQTSAHERRWASTSFADHSSGAGRATSAVGSTRFAAPAIRSGALASRVRICSVVSDATTRSGVEGDAGRLDDARGPTGRVLVARVLDPDHRDLVGAVV